MDIRLTPSEARVIGCLIEKQHTTPEQYPLSLNALTNACNQKSNRVPVMKLAEAAVLDTVQDLVRKHFVSEKSGFGSRVARYQQRFCNTDFGTLKFSDRELGILCVMLLRGAQTPGELRTRTERLCSFENLHEVETTLARLMQREDGPFVARLPRESGKREARYTHLFCGEAEPPAAGNAADVNTDEAGTDANRMDRLEQMVRELRDEVELLKSRLNAG